MSKNPFIVTDGQKFWQAITVVDTDGTPVDFGGGGGGTSDVKLVEIDPDLVPIETKISLLGQDIGVQNPIMSDVDSQYPKDIDIANSDFSGWTGSPLDLFASPKSAPVYNDTVSNPKSFKIAFNRTLYTNSIGLGCDVVGQSFGANINIYLLGSNDTVRKIFSSTGSVDSRLVVFDSEPFNAMIIEFMTPDPVYLTNITIRKELSTSSRMQGRTPSGNLVTMRMNDSGNPIVGITPQDIFGNIPIAEQYTIFDATRTNEATINLFFTKLLLGAGAANVYEKSTSSSILSVANNGDISAEQGRQRLKYQPLKALKWALTGTYTPEAGVEKYIMLADLDSYNDPVVDGRIYNGGGFCIKDGDIEAQIYNEGVGLSYPRSGWNQDRLDGTGESGIVLDLNYSQIMMAELEWLGVGSYQFILNIEGRSIPVHRVDHANNLITSVYMRTANLAPLWMIKSVGGSGSMRIICTAVVSGGGHNPIGVPNIAEMTTEQQVLNGNVEGVLFIRLKPDSYEHTVNIRGVSVIVPTSGDSVVRLLWNPSWSGGALTWVDKPNSNIQIAQGAGDNLITDKGIVMELAPISSDSDAAIHATKSSLRLGKQLQTNANQEGRYDVICLSPEPLNSNENFLGSIMYEDIF